MIRMLLFAHPVAYYYYMLSPVNFLSISRNAPESIFVALQVTEKVSYTKVTSNGASATCSTTSPMQ